MSSCEITPTCLLTLLQSGYEDIPVHSLLKFRSTTMEKYQVLATFQTSLSDTLVWGPDSPILCLIHWTPAELVSLIWVKPLLQQLQHAFAEAVSCCNVQRRLSLPIATQPTSL